MSSATSTSVTDTDNVPQAVRAPTEDQGFRPWHFFVLASLIAATAAVVMSRQSTPEHLILISLTIGAAGAAAAGLYRMLAPLAATGEGAAGGSTAATSERARVALEREKSLVLRSIKELEFDRAMGKLSPKDFDEMAGRLRARALMLMKQVDEGSEGYRDLIERELSARMATRAAQAGLTSLRQDYSGPPELQRRRNAGAPGSTDREAGRCVSCGMETDADASFCKHCGVRLADRPS